MELKPSPSVEQKEQLHCLPFFSAARPSEDNNLSTGSKRRTKPKNKTLVTGGFWIAALPEALKEFFFNHKIKGSSGSQSPRASFLFFYDLIGEVRIRFVRILIGLSLTWFTRYWFPEESISPLAKPFLTLPLDSSFVRTQSTEASPTYVATSPIACSYFVFPLISHQIWCFSIPSCYGEQRMKYNRFLHLSGSRFSLFLFLTPPRVVPNVWHFPYFVGSTNSLMIKLQPKIYDHIMFTVRISFIPSVCSQVPVILIRLPEPRREASAFTSNRRFFMVFPLITAALSTPPDIWCQIVARFPLSFLIELAISVALIVQVREEGWTSRMRLRRRPRSGMFQL
uniref:Transport membrane protein n=1 Tax=Gastrodia sp. BS-2023 TaxID=3076235 RepID=A0AA95Z663_9ASPA|nr:transport membrane protein [Gastrodia shimizuana]WNH36788.1 transport membrane protein [Gastrodia sp. BS-2023]WOE91445.1 transport membrane protein [Gastrodia flexistyla]